MTTKNDEKKNLRPIENEAQLGNVMNEDNELLFGCGSGCGCGSGSGCGSGCGCGSGSGSGSGCGCGCGCGGGSTQKQIIKTGGASKDIDVSTLLNYKLNVKGKVSVNVSDYGYFYEDGTMEGGIRTEGTIKGYVYGIGDSNKSNNVEYTTGGFQRHEIDEEISEWDGSYNISESVFCSNSIGGSGSSMGVTITIHYSIQPRSSGDPYGNSGEIDVTVSGLP